jgi:transposase
MPKQKSINSRKASFGREERTSTTTTITPTATSGSAPAPAPVSATAPMHDLIKLAIDVHGKTYVVARQVDNAPPQPPQSFAPEQFLAFAARQRTLAKRVASCYEAGCFGYGLHRRLAALGIENVVVAPQDWDERNKKVKTDNVDAAAMLSRLDRYLAGNRKALAVVRVPSVAEELRRGRVRQRQQVQSDRNRWVNQGKSFLLYHGIAVAWRWWQADRWEPTCRLVREQRPDAAEQILTVLAGYQAMALAVNEKLAELTRAMQQSQKDRPAERRVRGVGELSLARIGSEICDWSRFTNRRQVAGYTGLCPTVHGSGGRFTNGSVSKHGNRRLRAALVELAWLVCRYQPTYPPVLRWARVLAGRDRSARKKAVVAIARRLAVDLWRLETGRATAERLGLRLLKAA